MYWSFLPNDAGMQKDAMMCLGEKSRIKTSKFGGANKKKKQQPVFVCLVAFFKAAGVSTLFFWSFRILVATQYYSYVLWIFQVYIHVKRIIKIRHLQTQNNLEESYRALALNSRGPIQQLQSSSNIWATRFHIQFTCKKRVESRPKRSSKPDGRWCYFS